MPSTTRLLEDLCDAIDWRLSEIFVLISKLDGQSSPFEQILMQLIVARLYAHLEGGLKQMANTYLSWLQLNFVAAKDLRFEHQRWRHASSLRKTLTSASNLELLSHADIVDKFWESRIIMPIATQEEYSSMTHKEVSEIYTGLGFRHDVVDSRRAELYLLHRRRNPVAHGEHIDSTTKQTYAGMTSQMRDTVREVLYDFAEQILDQALNETYLESHVGLH